MAIVAWEKEAVALARPGCRQCMAEGVDLDANGVAHPCKCVCRKIFDGCYYKYRAITEGSRHDSPVVTSNHFGASRPYEEYVADFVLVSRRELKKFFIPNADALFDLHFIHMCPIARCAVKFGKTIDEVRGELLAIQVYLGRLYRELQPYGLFPLYEYFARSIT